MKVLLINPPDPPHVTHGQAPQGIMYLQSALKQHGFEAKLIDAFDYPWSRLTNEVKSINPDVIGIPCWTLTRINAVKLAQLCKVALPEVKIVFGGAHATFFPHHLLPYCDVVVLGEGEETIVDLMGNWDNLGKVAGIVTKFGRTEDRKLIENLDSVPFPDYTDIDLKRYEYDSKRFGIGELMSGIITSRGCVYGCSFCSTGPYWGRMWRARSPENVVDEFEWLLAKGVKCVDILDDVFTLNRKRTVNICKAIIERGLDVRWYCETRVDCVNAETLFWMSKAGCFSIFYGVESGSEKILKNIGKGFNVDQIKKAFKLTWDFGIYPEAMLMVGNPNESAETVEDTVKLISEIHPYSASSASLTMVFPCTFLYNEMKKKSYITDDYWLTDSPVQLYTMEHSAEELGVLRFKLTAGVLKNRSKLKYIVFVVKKVLRTMLKPKLFFKVLRIWSNNILES